MKRIVIQQILFKGACFLDQLQNRFSANLCYQFLVLPQHSWLFQEHEYLLQILASVSPCQGQFLRRSNTRLPQPVCPDGMDPLDSFSKRIWDLSVSTEEELLQQWEIDCVLLVTSGLGKGALPLGDIYCSLNCYVVLCVCIIKFLIFPCNCIVFIIIKLLLHNTFIP